MRNLSAIVKSATLAAAAALLAGCASGYQAWIDPGPVAAPAAPGDSLLRRAATDRGGASGGLVVIVSFSGGGMRAAALAYGVLEALREVRFQWDGRGTTLLEQVDVLAGVSGGSIPAAYYAAFGARTFEEFRPQFLYRDFGAALISETLSAQGSRRLSSPRYGRGDLLAEQLDELLFRGATFGQLGGREGPDLFVTATDLSLGTSFEFTPEQFRLICADLGAVPLAVAVAASNAAPVVFAPLTLQNYGGHCAGEFPWSPGPGAPADAGPQVRRYAGEQATYRDSAQRPYIHLVDGALADNLGLRRLLEDVAMSGGLAPALRASGARGVRRVVLLAVSAERQRYFEVDQDARVPSPLSTFRGIQYGVLTRRSAETADFIDDTVRGWREELGRLAGQAESPYAAGAEIYDIQVGLKTLPEGPVRQELIELPTAYSLARGQVDAVIGAAREILRASPEFQRLLRDLGASAP